MIPKIPFWLIKWGAVGALLLFIAWQVYGAGRQSILEQLKEDRIIILKDGKEIDNEVDIADDDGLCTLLGGCGVRDGADGE